MLKLGRYQPQKIQSSHLNTVNNKERRRRSAVSAAAQAQSACNLHVLSTAFHGGHAVSSFSLWIILFPPYPHPPPPVIFFFSLINQCERCLVPLAWGLMAGGRGFTSHGGVTFSRDCLCKKWKPLDILCTLQLLKWNK